jgi:hypothetical protein
LERSFLHGFYLSVLFNSRCFTICAVYLFPVSGVSGSSEIMKKQRMKTLGKQNCKILYSWRIYSFFQDKICWHFYFCFYDVLQPEKQEKRDRFSGFIASGYEVMKELLLLIMKGPIGLGLILLIRWLL